MAEETPKNGHQKHTEKQTLEDEQLQLSPQKRKSISVNETEEGSQVEREVGPSPGKQEPVQAEQEAEVREDNEATEAIPSLEQEEQEPTQLRLPNEHT